MTAGASPDRPRRRFGIGTILGLVFGLVVFVGGAVYLGAHIDMAVHSSGTVDAHVVGYAKSQQCASNGGNCFDVYPPKVSFTAGSKGTVTGTVWGLQPNSPMKSGATVPIRYNTASPTKVEPAHISWWDTWAVPVLIVLIGAVIIWVALPNRRKRQ